ncbi:NOC3p-domain-containing protein, partial [Hanseniaspora valbyensis NRRL Y-1626]
ESLFSGSSVSNQDIDSLLNQDVSSVNDHVREENALSRKIKRRKRNDYENEDEREYGPRTLNYDHENDGSENIGLPIKVNGKVVIQKSQSKKQKKEKEVLKEIESDNSVEDDDENSKTEDIIEEQEPVDTVQSIIQLKEEVAALVNSVIELPEDSLPQLTRLVKMTKSKNVNTCKFSTLALIPLFKSIIPGYKIRALTAKEKTEKQTKEVKKLRNFEDNLVTNYLSYIETIESLNKPAKKGEELNTTLYNIGGLVICELIKNFKHFNGNTDIFKLAVKRDSIHFFILRNLNKLLKLRNYRCYEYTLLILLKMDILEDYIPEEAKEDDTVKIKKKDRVHLSKKQRKIRKELKEIESDMVKAEQAVSKEEREKNQSEILRLTLQLYLTILKNKESLTNLIGVVLEGLGKFGHMANFDLLGDFLDIFKEIIIDINDDDEFNENERAGTTLNGRLILLCIVTAFTLVTNHLGLKFQMDLSFFINELYKLLPVLSVDPNLETTTPSPFSNTPYNTSINDKSISEFVATYKVKINTSTTSELLLKSLDFVFFKTKNATLHRAKIFNKQLHSFVLQTPEKTSLAVLKFLEFLSNKYGECHGMYDTKEIIANYSVINGQKYSSWILEIADNNKYDENGYQKLTGEGMEMDTCNIDDVVNWDIALLESSCYQSISKATKNLINGVHRNRR